MLSDDGKVTQHELINIQDLGVMPKMFGHEMWNFGKGMTLVGKLIAIEFN
jgi:hypothetical protein